MTLEEGADPPLAHPAQTVCRAVIVVADRRDVCLDALRGFEDRRAFGNGYWFIVY
jgi:hypothetical protein